MSDEKEWILAWNEGSAAWIEPIDEKTMKDGYDGESTWNPKKAARYTRQEVEVVMNIMHRNKLSCYAYTIDGFACANGQVTKVVNKKKKNTQEKEKHYLEHLYNYIKSGNVSCLQKAADIVKSLPKEIKLQAFHHTKSITFHQKENGVYFGKIPLNLKLKRKNLLTEINSKIPKYVESEFREWISEYTGDYKSSLFKRNNKQPSGHEGKFGTPKDPYGPNWYGSRSYEFDFMRIRNS